MYTKEESSPPRPPALTKGNRHNNNLRNGSRSICVQMDKQKPSACSSG